MSLTNTILVGHTVGIAVAAGNTATLETTLWGTDTWANDSDWGGEGSITTNEDVWGQPGFVNPDAGDYHIGPGSEALDAAIESGVRDDLDGEARRFDGDGDGEARSDIGADEFSAALSVSKEASPTEASVGETITYSYRLENTGLVALTYLRISDDRMGTISHDVQTLAPNEVADVTANYRVSEDDLPGPITNQVMVTARPSVGGGVAVTASAHVAITSHPAIQVMVSPSESSAHVGETITYTYRVENIGDVTLTDVSADDDRLGAISLDASTLAPGETTTGAAIYVVHESDLPGPLTNSVTTAGRSPLGQVVSHSHSASVRLTGRAAVEVTKRASPTAVVVGETISYAYTVTNIGDVTLFDVGVSDDRLGDIELSTHTLAPGDTTTGRATHTVVARDRDGCLENTAIVTGRSPAGLEVTDTAHECVEVKPRPFPCVRIPAAVLLVLLGLVLRRQHVAERL